MQTRSKVVEVSGHKFQIRKLPPDVGSFICMRMMGVSMRMQQPSDEAPPQEPVKEPETPVEPPSGEMRVRAITFLVFSGGMSFDDYKFIQNHCMRVVTVVENREGVDFPLPVMTATGDWTPDGSFVMDDVGLVMKLTTEVLVYCFADFFAASSSGT